MTLREKSRFARLAVVALALVGAACTTSRETPILATARIAPDFETYALRRVGLMPIAVDGTTGIEDRRRFADFSAAVHAEFSRTTPYEWIALDASDLAELPSSDPIRLGYFETGTLIDLTRRFQLDGLLFVELLDHHPYPPQRLLAAAELVAADTGLVVWSSRVHLDAADSRVRWGLENYFGGLPQEGDATEDWEIALLSPRRFAGFAAWQLARML